MPRQCQLARYTSRGKGYDRHLDQCNLSGNELGLLEWLRLSDYRGRALTAILYLNDDWQIQRDGGALRCYAGWKQYREGSDAFLAGQWQQDPQSEIVTCEKNETHCVLLEYAWPFAGGGYGFSQGRKRVIQRRFNVGVLEVVPNRKASTL